MFVTNEISSPIISRQSAASPCLSFCNSSMRITSCTNLDTPTAHFSWQTSLLNVAASTIVLTFAMKSAIPVNSILIRDRSIRLSRHIVSLVLLFDKSRPVIEVPPNSIMCRRSRHSWFSALALGGYLSLQADRYT